MRNKKYWEQVGDHDNMEATRANPDHLATPDPIEGIADKSLLYQAVRNLKEPYKELIIDHLGLFGRDAMSIRQIAKKQDTAKSNIFDMYKKAQNKLRKEFFRLLGGGKIDEVS